MKKLCVVIPTYNRPDCIKFLLSKSEKWINDYDVDYYICDTSESDKTVDVFNKYKDKYKEHLILTKIDNYPDKTTDLKIATCFEKLMNSYQYIHLCGDGLAVDIPKYYTYFLSAAKKGFDIIHFNSNISKDKIIYSSGKKFAQECGWYVTYYGATILSTELIRKAHYNTLLSKYRNTGFLFWFGMISAVSSDNEKIVAYKDFPLISNPYKPTNSSYQPGKFISFWVVSWNRIIDDLPEYYNEIKPKIKKDIGINLNLYSFGNLVRLKTTNNLRWKDVKHNRLRFKSVTEVPFWRIALVSLTPSCILRFCIRMKRIIRKK